MRVYVDTAQVKKYTDHLKRMHRSNFPIVVRQTLNDLAFDVKKNTLLKSADREFILRNPSFFRKHSGVKKADGWNVNEMHSEVGIFPQGSRAAAQLTQQEYGGVIPKRSFIYMNQARTGGSKTKKVRRQNYIGTIKLIRGNPNVQRSDKSQYIADAFMAKKMKKSILKDDTLFNVKSIKKGDDDKVFVKLFPIASYKENRSVRVRSRPFLRHASEITYKRAEEFFVKNAEKRLEK